MKKFFRCIKNSFGVSRSYFGASRSIFGASRSYYGVSKSYFGVSRSYFGASEAPSVHQEVLSAPQKWFRRSIFVYCSTPILWSRRRRVRLGGRDLQVAPLWHAVFVFKLCLIEGIWGVAGLCGTVLLIFVGTSMMLSLAGDPSCVGMTSLWKWIVTFRWWGVS